MKRISLLWMVLLSLSFSVYGQGLIRGQVTDENNQPAEYINVVLLATADSNLIKLELTDGRGRYELANIPAGEYFLHFMGLSYAEQYSQPFTLKEGDTYTAPPVQLSIVAQNLQTVEVSARRPMLEQQAGKLVVNVEQSITGQTGSVTDLLKKVPGMVVVNNQIQMAGRQGVTILIDGRPTNYMDVQSLLREMPANNIARIEVISQPGAAFDAEGTAGVINIILKKNALLGANGQVSLGAGYGELWKYRANGQLSYRNGPLNLTANAGYNRRTWVEGLDLDRQIGNLLYRQSNREPGLPNSYNGRLGADYDLSDRHRIGAAANYSQSINDAQSVNSTQIIADGGEVLSAFTTYNNRNREWYNINADAYYRWKIDTTGRELSADYNRAYFKRRSLTNLQTEGGDFNDRRNAEPADTRIQSVKLDYKHPISTEWRLDAGLKYSQAKLDNELQATVFTNNEWVNDTGLSNRFTFDEDIAAAYLTFAFKKGQWDANLGLRYEDARSKGYSYTLDSTINRRYQQLFPSLSVAAPLTGKLGWSLAYSYRIERPRYYDLNPFVSYLDPLTFEKGNPFLRPELTHSGQFSLTYDKQPFFNLSYDLTNNAITQVTEQDDATGAGFSTTVNLDRYVRYGGSLFFPLDFIHESISGYGGAMLFYNQYVSDYLDAEFNQDQWNLTGFMQVNAKLPAKISLEVTGWYQGKGLDGIIAYNPLWGVDVGLERKFINDQLRVQLSAEGVIQRFWTGQVNYQNMDFVIGSTWEAPVVNLNLTWKFGNQYLKKDETRRSAAEEERRRAQENK